MPENLSAKSSPDKIVDAVTAEGGNLAPGDSLQTVSDKMVALGTNVLPVSDGGRLVGLADQPNPGLNASSHGHDPKTVRISETMNRDIVFCHEDDDCADALRKMEERKLSHLPVVDHEMRMIALVAREDLSARIGKADADHTDVGTVGSAGVATSGAGR
jgi:CBS domain-containing protein